MSAVNTVDTGSGTILGFGKVPAAPKGSKASKSGKKKPNKKARASTAPKSKPMPNGKSVHASEPKREPVWSPRRVAIVKAMRSLNATSAEKARTATEIGTRAGKVDGVDLGKRVDLVKIVLDVYRTAELLHNGFAKSTRLEGDRELRYFLTEKGWTTTFPDKK